MTKEDSSVLALVNNDGCFDLQFRRDTRHERTNSPTYYRWKAQFVVTAPKDDAKNLEKLKKEMGCGKVHVAGTQARFSVQKIDDICEYIIPYFGKNKLEGNKKKDFELWAKGVEIIRKNKGKQLSGWKKHDLNQLIEINKSAVKYKNRPRQPKWLQMAQTLAKSI